MPLQDTRNLALTTPLGKDKLLLQQMTAREELGRPFEYRVIALSEDFNIKLEQLLGESVTVSLDAFGGKKRYFNGQVSRFSHMTASGGLARYELIVRPWLWFLTRSSDCRIFQEMSVPDIIKQVFRDRGFSDFDDRLRATYRTWEYCVQYRETDFNFVSRLMEQEGIFYYFKHTERGHTLVLADSYAAHESVPDYENVPYFPRADKQRRERDHVYDWCITQQVQPGKYEMDDYNFKNPASDLKVQTQTQRDHAMSAFEFFDYPGEYVDASEGSHYVQVRNEELHAQYERVDCSGNARGLTVGALFTLEDYPREDQNREHLIISAVYEVFSDDYQVSGDAAQEPFQMRFTAMDAKEPFRTARTTPKPTVQGPQTAVVVGKAGEEIWCDEFGRVKVQFHWDRHSSGDETSSCWVRVSQTWAGVKWGSMHIPRMGHEVIVDFLEGDPDRPIITGRVYNGDNMPHYALPANQTRSGIMSRSTKDAGLEHFNEIRFEDKKGEEEMYIHAEKDHNTVVENNQTIKVGFDDQEPGDRSLSVHNDETVSIGQNRSETVGANETISIGVNRSEDVGKNETISIGENRTENVGKNETISIAENRVEDVGKDETITIGGDRTESVGKSEQVSIADDRKHDVGKNAALDVGKALLLTAGDSITLKTGSASISMKKDGTITIKGKDITVNGSGKINVKASAALGLKGSKITQN